MTLHPRHRAHRAGFTLIELLVVIAIIAILVGLTTVAVFRVFVRGAETQARRDLSQLAAAISGYKQEFNVSYVPSRIILYERGPFPQTTQLERDSRAYLKKMFPGIDLDSSTTHFDWNGNGVVDGPHILEGHYCLVFFVGGIPDPANNATQRFSANPTNPTVPGGERLGSRVFEFQAKQLVRTPLDPNGRTFGFFYYNDPWETPYAYFSNYGRQDGYNKYGTSDCASLGISPYIRSTTNNVVQYWNRDSFQIVSGGKDKNLGAGGLWGPGIGTGAGTDDNMSNFHEGQMR